MKVLFAASEAHPLLKTGGLADVCGSLPLALKKMRHDVRLVMPAYPQAMERIEKTTTVAEVTVLGCPEPIRLIEGRLPGSTVKVYLVDAPLYFDRPGNPYHDADHNGWPDNAARFASLCRVVVEMAQDRCGLKWQPEVVHCHDWQTGLVPPLLSLEKQRPATLFTIHNLAYTGTFDWPTFQSLSLPYELWSIEGLEFYGNFSFMKGGLQYADHINTVSPTYSREICTPTFGHGFDGLLQHRMEDLSGILNGVDYATWDPRNDSHIPHAYSPTDLKGKTKNKLALQKQFGLPQQTDIPLIGHIGRLVDQKGADLILEALPELMQHKMQLVILGSGEDAVEQGLLDAADQYPEKIAVHIGYDESLSHLIEAGADMFLMPSRFEPCGLNQIYSLRYGTVPIVHRTGGLADTVIDSMEHTLEAGIASGFIFDDPSHWALSSTVKRALDEYAQPSRWKKLMKAGMHQDFSWKNSAKQYVARYRTLLAAR